MNCYNDKVSEKYRKYVIQIKLSKDRNFYLLWGTDLNDGDKDKLLIDKKANILAFRSISLLLSDIRNQHTFKDKENLIEWSERFLLNRPYIVYNILEVKKIINQSNFFLNNLSQEGADRLLNFYNLFSDYAYQINSDILFSIIQEKNMELFFNYLYDSFFWNSEGRRYEIKQKIKDFDDAIFIENYQKMISTFESKLHKM